MALLLNGQVKVCSMMLSILVALQSVQWGDITDLLVLFCWKVTFEIKYILNSPGSQYLTNIQEQSVSTEVALYHYYVTIRTEGSIPID